jgi:hypothetical protein
LVLRLCTVRESIMAAGFSAGLGSIEAFVSGVRL